MAEYIRFRLTAAKAGVSMALLALVGGLVAKGESGPERVSATPASAHSTPFLKLGGVTGNTKAAFLKVEGKLEKISDSLASAEAKLTKSYYGKHATDSTFEKIKIADAKFLSITTANSDYLKIGDAAAKFEKLGATAVNSAKLGGLGASAFLQGRGNVISGALSYVPGSPRQLLVQTPDGKIALYYSNAVGSGPVLTVANGTGEVLPAVQSYDDGGSGATPVPDPNTTADIAAHAEKDLSIGTAIEPEQVHLQLFPNAESPAVISVLVSFEPDPANSGHIAVVGQMLIGLL